MARRALLIANGQFEDTRITSLRSPVADLTLLEELLIREEVGGYRVEHCFDCQFGPLRRSVQRFFDSAAPSDFLFVMVSGHGIKDSDGKLHFATKDTDFDAINATALEARFLHERMDRSAAAQKVLILDTCYSGAFAKDYVSKGITQAVTRDEFGDDHSRGKVVITASTGIQVAFERLKGSHTQSRFTGHLIEGIATGRADPSGSGMVTVDDLYDYICEELRVERAEDPEAPLQNPQRWYFGLQGSVCVARNPTPPPSGLPAELMARITSEDAVVRSLAVDDLTTLVRSGGRLAPLALSTLFDLSDDDSNHVGASADRAIRRLGPLAQQPAPLPTRSRLSEQRSPVARLAQEASQTIEVSSSNDASVAHSTAGAGGLDEGSPEPAWHELAPVRASIALIALAVLVILSFRILSGTAPSRSPSSSPAATSKIADPVDTMNSKFASNAELSDAAPIAELPAAEITEPPNATAPELEKKPFDCKKASMPLDWAICYDNQSFDLNSIMSATWESIHRTRSAGQRRERVDQQMKWILGTQEKCGLPQKGRPSDVTLAGASECVRGEYAARIEALDIERAANY